MERDPDYCSTCYGSAKEHGRTVRMTDVYKYPICGLCESRIRNGLVQYHPSNGTEFYDYFIPRCEVCRHYIDNPDNPLPGKLQPPYAACAHGVLDRLLVQQVESRDHISMWFDPADLSRYDESGTLCCPAICKRFTHKDDSDGASRDPAPRDCPGQMTFDDINIPIEKTAEHRKLVTI